MNKVHYLLIVQLFFICATLTAQKVKTVNKTCGFDKVHKEMMLNDPDYALKTKQFNEQLQLNAHPKGAAPVYQIPVVVHVMSYGTDVYSGYLTDDQIKQGIIELNERYRRVGVGYNTHADGADVEIEFALAVRDESDNCTDGIVRVDMSGYSDYVSAGVGSGGMTDGTMKALSRWNPTTYYNVYVVSEIDNNNCLSGSWTAGYAYLAGSHGNAVDGTVILACSFTGESTLAHELGHSLNLYHTFEGGSCSQTDCATQGDLCCDTPPIAGTNNSCSTRECSSTQQIENYMDYTGDACQNMFTNDQTTRMRAALTGIRASFLAVNGNMALVPPAIHTTAATSQGAGVCAGNAIRFYDNSFCIPNTFQNSGWSGITFSWTFDNGVDAPITSSLQNPSITFTDAGIYDVTLSITTAQGTSSVTNIDMIAVSAGSPAAACSPTSSNAGNFWQTCSQVTFGAISNSTSEYVNVAYTDYSCDQIAVVTENLSYDMTIALQSGGSGAEYGDVYIDYNNDGSFTGSENVFSQIHPDGNATASYTQSVTIPASAVKNTLLRMRVAAEAGSTSSICGNNFIGDVEDYGVFVLAEVSMPVELISLSASLNRNSIDINWTTRNEQKISYYEVQHSADHKNFVTLGKLDAKHALELNNEYRFTHELPVLGFNYYRLKMINKDGSFNYSDLRKVNLREKEVRFAPNPFNHQITISGIETEATVAITNLIGETVLSTLVTGDAETIETSNLPAGTYIVIIKTENSTFVKKLIKSVK